MQHRKCRIATASKIEALLEEALLDRKPKSA